jgi:hypothetical protein
MSIHLRWFKYTLPSGRLVILTNRPDRVSNPSEVSAFINEHNPACRVYFCDDIVDPVWASKVPSHWYPWVPGRSLPAEHVYAALTVIDEYIGKTTDNRAIWLHCDSSTMRAPTFFGHWLRAHYADNVVEKIVAGVEYDPRREPGLPLYENPIEYAQFSRDRDPRVADLVEAYRSGGNEAAYKVYMRDPFMIAYTRAVDEETEKLKTFDFSIVPDATVPEGEVQFKSRETGEVLAKIVKIGKPDDKSKA